MFKREISSISYGDEVMIIGGNVKSDRYAELETVSEKRLFL